MVTESLDHAILAKEYSQLQSLYKAIASLTEFELKKILIDKMDKNESYMAAPEHRVRYDVLIKSYELDKTIFSTYDKVYSLKRSRKDKDKDEDPSAGLDRGLKKRKTSKDAESTKGSKAKKSKSGSSKGNKFQSNFFGKSIQSEEPEFEVADSDMHKIKKNDEKTQQQGRTQSWLMTLAYFTNKPSKTFDELMRTPIDLSTYIMNGLKITNLTQETLLGPAFRLLKALMANTQTSFHPDQSSHITYLQHPQPNKNFVQQPSFSTNYMPQPMQNPKDNLDPTTAMNKGLALIAKAFKLNTIPTNNNQRSSLIPCNSQIAQSGKNTSQDIKMKMVDDNYGNGNVRTSPVEGNGNGINGNSIRCYNFRGKGHYASNCTVKPRKWDVAYLQQQLQIALEEEAGIQSIQEEFKFMAAADTYEETKRVKVNYTSEDTLQQASTFGTQSYNAPVYDSDGSTETNALSRPVTSNSVPSTRESKVMQTVNVIAPRIFRTNPSKTSRVDNVVPNKPVKTNVRIKPITVSQPNVIHKQQANSDLKGFSSTRLNNTAKTRRSHPKSNYNSDRVPSKNGMNSRADNQSANVLIHVNQKKHKANAKKSKELGSKGSLASSRPSKPKTYLRWILTGRIFSMCGKLTASTNTKNKFEKSVRDNASTSNPSKPSSKGFSNSASLLGRWIPTGRIFSMCGKLTASTNTKNKFEKSVHDNASTSNPSKPSSKGFSNSASLLGRLSRLRKQHTSIYPIAII
nr:hypothetical protein [Tanacetum cinerariifolium]